MKNQIQTLLQTPTWISIFLGVCLLLWGQIDGEIPPSVQMAFFAFFIIATGIPHGALDHLVAAQTAQIRAKNFQIVPFLLEYLGTMAIYATVWYFFPTLSLLFFLLISAWHFGETDLNSAPNTHLWNAAKLLLGAAILAFILLSHAEETRPVWERITQNGVWANQFWQTATAYGSWIGSILGLLLSIVIVFAYRQKSIVFNRMHWLRWSFILILTYFLPLLPAFALYFGGWHALSAFGSIKNYLSNGASQANFTPLSIWLESVPFTVLAVLFLVGGFWYWQHFLQTWDPLPVLFIFLSLITLPHLRVMHPINAARGH